METTSKSADTGLTPFLAVTGAPTEAECRAKVAAMQGNGARSFVIYARSGLEVEYMGEKWLRLCEWFCDEAARRGMKVWLYDEYNWPSGSCKGRVPRENAAWRHREIGVFPRPGGGWLWEEAVAPDGWANVCEPEAVRRFIELTHEVYAKRLARFFAGGTIVGFFSDEPGHPAPVAWKNGIPAATFRDWSGMEDEYRAETGSDFRADVEAWLRGDAGVANLSAIYSRLLGRRFHTSFFDQIRTWCEAHGVAFTGHLFAENAPPDSVRTNGDPMLCIRGFSVPGIDEVATSFDPDGIASPWKHPVEWTTFNLARQAILNNGNGGMAELFACGPGDLSPAVLRQMVWMCAFHGIDRYVACMDVMDERGLVEKNGYISAAGPVHPWYERHAVVFAEECRGAAAFAAKRLAGREVAVRYPRAAASSAALLPRPVGGESRLTGLNALLGALETHQFIPRLVAEDEPCDLPLIFSCRPSGKFDEENTGAKDLDAADALALCRAVPGAVFRILEADGETDADALMVRTCEDGTSAVLNMRPFATRRLIAERGDERCAFTLEPHDVRVFAPGPLPPDAPPVTEMRSLAAVRWSLRRDRPNLLRVDFTGNGGRRGTVVFAEPVEAREVVRKGRNELCPVRSRDEARPSQDIALPSVFAPLYREGEPRRFEAGTTTFTTADGEPDANYFLPALWLAGDFRVFGGAVFAEKDAPVGFGSFADLGYHHYAGGLTWRTTVTAPTGCGWRLRCDTGGSLASVRFCGVELGVRAWEPFEWKIPASLSCKTGELEITVFSSALPMFGADETEGKPWRGPGWGGYRTPGARCGLFSSEWVKSLEV